MAKEAGIKRPTDEQLRTFDRQRKGKKTSNDNWQSPSDPDARITKMKDGTTGLGYKAENAVHLESEIVVAADVKPADAADGETVKDTVIDAQGNLKDSTKHECRIAEVVADKGYHKAGTLVGRRRVGAVGVRRRRSSGNRSPWSTVTRPTMAACSPSLTTCRRGRDLLAGALLDAQFKARRQGMAQTGRGRHTSHCTTLSGAPPGAMGEDGRVRAIWTATASSTPRIYATWRAT